MSFYSDRLAQVQQAIMNIETGAQEAEIAGRHYVMANIKDLYDQERWLLAMVKRETRGGGIPVRTIVREP